MNLDHQDRFLSAKGVPPILVHSVVFLVGLAKRIWLSKMSYRLPEDHFQYDIPRVGDEELFE